MQRQDSPALNDFLASVERRALRMAKISLGNYDDALDVVQDAMISLVKNYSKQNAEQWRPLFFRILNNKIVDHCRRRAVMNKFKQWFGTQPITADIDPAYDQATLFPAREACGEQALQSQQRLDKLEQALTNLPRRQQQAFMLRCWEGLNTAATASAMGCSEGSVKTHYARALQSLRQQLEGLWP